MWNYQILYGKIFYLLYLSLQKEFDLKKILLFFVSIVLLSATSLQKFDSKSFREFVQLKNDMGVFYLLYGKYDGIEQKAYLHITKDYDKQEIASITLPQRNNENFNIILDSKTLGFGLDGEMLVISGNNDGIDFNFTQDSNAKLNKIYFIESNIFKTIKLGDKFKDKVTYKAMIAKPIILNSALKNANTLNKSMSNALNIEELKENLDSKLKDDMNAYGKIKFNTEFFSIGSVGYIDDNILEIDTLSYRYTGGAHGSNLKSMELYDINSGEKIPSTLEEVFNINDENKDELLALLSAYLKPQKERLFMFPIDTLPSSFFLSEDGIIFMWNEYEIAPYASGMITAKIGFNEIKKWIKDGVVKDYINKRINDARSNNK